MESFEVKNGSVLRGEIQTYTVPTLFALNLNIHDSGREHSLFDITLQEDSIKELIFKLYEAWEELNRRNNR